MPTPLEPEQQPRPPERPDEPDELVTFVATARQWRELNRRLAKLEARLRAVERVIDWQRLGYAPPVR
jgi:hypothetical protein